VTGDAAAGRQVFQKCRACHSLDAGRNGVGHRSPKSWREGCCRAGFNFSPAMKASNLTWDAATLDAYLTDRRRSCQATRCHFRD
jgi:cytochrome c2